jgi:hypothetical protein
MRRRLALALALLALVAAACGGSDDDDGAGEGDDAAAEEATDAGADIPDPEGVTVELLDPGAEPRQVLRLDPDEGCESRARQRQGQSIDIEIDGQSQSVDQDIEIDIVYRCQEITEDEISLEIEYEDARIASGEPSSEEVLRDALESMAGAVGKGTYDRRGSVLALTAPTPDLPGAAGAAAEEVSEGLQDEASRLSSPLPAEPVGVGARWTVSSEGTLSGLPYQQTSTFTITSIEGDVVVADTVVEQVFPPGPMDLASGVDARVVEGGMTGRGTTTWDLRQVVPLSTSITEGDVVAVIEGPDGEVQMRQHLRIEQDLVAR